MPKAGVVGAGAMGKVHIKSYLELGFEVAVADSSQEALNRIKEEFPQVSTYQNAKDMIQKEVLDIISIVTTGPYHAQVCGEAARGKVKRILCEKPIATNIKDAKAMIQTVKGNNSILSINHGRRWFPPYMKLQEMIQEGVIGELKTVYVAVGGGRLGCVGSHFFDLIRMLSQKEVVQVFGSIDKRYAGDHKGRNVFDPGGFTTLNLQDHVKAFIDLSEDLGIPPQITITGSMGTIHIDEQENMYEIRARSVEDKTKRLGQYTLPLVSLPFEGQSMDLIKMTQSAIQELMEDKASSCSGEDGLKALEVVLAIHLSSQENKPLNLPLTDETFDVRIT